MSLVPRDNWHNFSSLFDSFFPTIANDQNDFFAPKVDISDKGSEFEIKADLPGVDKNDIHVALHNGTLSIEASVEHEDIEEKEGKVIRKERHSGSFIRQFSVGKNVQESDVHASFKNGVLTLVLPKLENEAPQSSKIPIR